MKYPIILTKLLAFIKHRLNIDYNCEWKECDPDTIKFSDRSGYPLHFVCSLTGKKMYNVLIRAKGKYRNIKVSTSVDCLYCRGKRLPRKLKRNTNIESIGQ